MSHIVKKIFLLLMLIGNIGYCQEVLSDLKNTQENTTVLNDELRKTSRRIRDLEGGISLTSGVTGILPVANGGTGADNSAIVQGSVPYTSATGVISWLSPGTSGQCLKTQGSSANPTWSNPLSDYAAGTYLIAGPSEIVSMATSSYTKFVELRVSRSGTLSTIFGMSGNNGGGNMYGQIYRNGSAVGTLRTLAQNSAWTEYSEDIAGWVAGDLLQIYAKSDANGWEPNCFVGGLRVYDNAPIQESFTPGYAGIGNASRVMIWYSGADDPTDATGIKFNSAGSVGDLYIFSGGGAGATLYVKTDATTWTAK